MQVLHIFTVLKNCIHERLNWRGWKISPVDFFVRP